MLRIVFSIMMLMLCSFALADSHHLAKSAEPSSVSAMVELDAGVPDSTDLPFALLDSSASIAPIYLLDGRVPKQAFQRLVWRFYGNTSIRSPPLTL
ncbi:hypothetical protein [Zhongshania sp. BJYM1]|uniref:hypothetical protein n=1 Tax=Zhongshania aquatica TaxID=2965069 RepID=UPI0022B33329|nr:hypothetical protein [Marortus sp. BJYM1]